tara:strand:+ start:854 stop:1477 length:624 start_codon:yes stop_codon:yes gene_type:complete
MTIDTPKIFLIGFNKCGTTSFHDYFKANNISSVHWRANTLAMAIDSNHRSSRKLLSTVDTWTAYTDLICIPGSPWGRSNSKGWKLIEANKYFRELHRDYPTSLFILNTRDPFQWLNSRLKHDQGKFAQAYLEALKSKQIKNKKQLKQYWLKLWYRHHIDTIDYFSINAPEQFLLFHISESPAKTLNRFLDPYFSITFREFPHHHKSE